MNKMKIDFRLYDTYLAVLGVLTSLPILAPILLKLGEFNQVFLWIGRVIYFIYSFTCHQFDSRSLFLFDYQYAWCARDTGIWLGVFAAALYLRRRDAQPLPWYWLIAFTVPIALDGGIQTIATFLGLGSINGATNEILYVSNNFTRFLTGALFGIGLSLVFSSYLANKVQNVNFQLQQRKFWPSFAAIFITMTIIVYPVLVGVWSLTSPNQQPSDFLDSAVKIPANQLFMRRRYGACPTLASGLFSFNC